MSQFLLTACSDDLFSSSDNDSVTSEPAPAPQAPAQPQGTDEIVDEDQDEQFDEDDSEDQDELLSDEIDEDDDQDDVADEEDDQDQDDVADEEDDQDQDDVADEEDDQDQDDVADEEDDQDDVADIDEDADLDDEDADLDDEDADPSISHFPILPGKYELRLKHQGRIRSYTLVIPNRYNHSKKVPLVFGLHGMTGTPEFIEDNTRLTEYAQRLGFIAVYPKGNDLFLDDGFGWNLLWRAQPRILKQDRHSNNVAFLRKITRVLRRNLKIKRRRIYAMGFSNGGTFAQNLAAKAPRLFAAVGAVGATIGGANPFSQKIEIMPKPKMAVPVYLAFGRQDLRYINIPLQFRPAAIVGFWVLNNKCDLRPILHYNSITNVAVYTYKRCNGRANVKAAFYDQGHVWPRFGNSGFNATKRMLKFFRRHRLPIYKL
jgi:poly(3-hydroxybutyrate) depolymerase